MDLEAEILREYSKPQAQRIARYIGDDQRRFDQLMKLFLADTYRVTQRAAWIVSHCIDQYPNLIKPHLKAIIYNLNGPVHVAVKRNTVRILQFVEIPNSLKGPLANICFNYLQSGKETIAVKVFAMTVLANMAKTNPELGNELRILIEDQMPYASAGFASRGSKILRNISDHQ